MGLNVIALGGNAILETDPTDKGQKAVVEQAAEAIAAFIEQGEQVILCHGNGPQVGNLLLQQQAGISEKNPPMSLDTCVAMTQGSIGYWLQQALTNAFMQHGINQPVVSIVTQVLVDPNDPSFQKPTKPIGPFYTEEEAKKSVQNNGGTYVEDAGRGYRKVVASPQPKEIVEKEALQALVAANVVTICAGGGGIPVIESSGLYQGVEAVNDKDFSAAVLADAVGADRLIVLTGVEHIYINYGKPEEQALGIMTPEEAKEYVAAGHFAAGSMLPKVEAAVRFVASDPKRQAVITSIGKLNHLTEGAGTVIQQTR
ncbi:Carbamate kinase [Enterococcus mundtii 3F]|uniref:carbamate kinase n=1 Tax=Enterococcus mundtii TaxID=53346 RepID=UPI00230368F1|nr:carbamate kinase [Enterococcus mundtii]MDA9460302.1 Carbamate kinase [Enterococcus mundtii 3F]